MKYLPHARTALAGALSVALTGVAAISPAQAEVRFYPVVNLANNTGLSFSPSIAAGPENNIYVAWYDNTLGGNEILFSRSIDNGVTFSAPANLSNNLGFSTFPTVATEASGKIHVAWQDTEYGASEILHAYSTDGGLTFSVPVNISNDAGTSGRVSLAIDGTTVYAAWVDGEGLSVARSVAGAAFATVYRLDADSNLDPLSPKLAVGPNGRLHLAYQRSDGVTPRINYAFSDDQGASFSPLVQLSTPEMKSSDPAITADASGYVYVAWTDSIGSPEIQMAISADHGATFAAPINVTNNTGISIAPDLTVDAAGVLYMVWQDTTPGSYEAMFTRSLDHGVTFDPQVNIAPSALGSLITSVAVDSLGNILTVWDDNRFGTFDPIVAIGRDGLPAIDNPKATPNPFSPNADGTDDATTITADLTQNMSWQLDIYDPNNRIVRNYRATGTELTVTWDGKDRNGRLLADGKYTYKILGTTPAKVRAIPAEAKVTINTVSDNVPPLIDSFVIEPAIFGPDGDGRRETIDIDADFNKSVNWVLSYRTLDGVELFSQTGAGAHVFATWDGKDYGGTWQPNGAYKVVLQGTDDNGGTVSAEQSIQIDTVKPVISNIGFVPAAFTPDGDGVDDTTTLNFTLSEGALVTVYIYESNGGSLVRELYREPWYIVSPTDISVVWDGLSGTGVKVPAGNYIFKIWARDYAANKAPEYPYVTSVTVK
ncbi:MAG: hypothetical protein B7Y26_09265 [Hydrogenophilales bacterium 16-64-46]|nr:MAG: hypothetical protein B7Z32_12245 [Hydrogenophilales bacterium 12-64-13]OYZ05147.1 MAG: hypothetical protein B7Y26_09265 [Hydrogenophilales bacterium 16-64-46]OZA37965.1 MAG: hypothetical protein B7X87_09195 [Hydrogenophilales bacterium 17-64-34]HQT00503.1 FlgD immunoglobulin-like domain containing protein [Thiobacillus sp.]